MNRIHVVTWAVYVAVSVSSSSAAEQAPLKNLQLADLNSECTAFSLDGKFFAVAFDNDLDKVNYDYGPLPPTKHLPQEAGIGIWEVATGKRTHWLEAESHGRAPACVRFTPDGRKLGAVGVDSESLFVWDLSTGKLQKIKLVDGSPSIGYRFEFLNDGRDVAVTNSGGAINVYEIESQDLLHEFEGCNKEDSLVVLRGGKYLASGFHIWSLTEDKLVREYDHRTKSRRILPQSNPDVVVASPQNDLMFGMRTYASNPGINTWRIADNLIAHPFLVAFRKLNSTAPADSGGQLSAQRGNGKLTDLAISACGTLLATSGYDRKARIWHLPSQTQIATFESGPKVLRKLSFLGAAGAAMHDVEFSPDGKHLMTLCRDGDINLWDVSRLVGLAKAPEGGVNLTRFWIGKEQIEEERTEPPAVEPTERRPKSADVTPGRELLARNANDKWYHARVVAVLPQGKARVHFTGYSVSLNSVVTRTKLRLP